ncbi:K02A2.6-like [Cordylochernes scorpioides]|uniref:K02A2.6-like n=1 Tax=Cordylochernes scorpioides TaxID=51811 RepID=A0ABY6KE69_9ARAC|nr:K02A2.6-like [Cordylochernes scorpioides]
MVETRSGKMQDPAQERIQAEESAKPQPGATIGRDASSDPVVLNPNIDIPKYDGTEDPRPWIESLEEIGFLYHWADYIISRYAAMNMTGSAKTWLNLHKASFTSWENIKIRLIQDFSLDANKEELRMKLNRMQHWNEPAIRFAEDILVLCNKVDPAMEEETKIEHVIGGLKKEYSFALYLNPPKTTDDLLVVCKKMDYFEKKYRERVEKSRNLYNGPRYSRPQQQSRYVPPTAARNYQTTSRPQAPVSNNYKNDSPPTPRQYRNNFPQPSTPRRPYNPNFVPKPNLQRNTYNKSQEVSKNRTEDGRPICFKCSKPGHVARYCRVKFIRILEEDPADTQEKVEEKCQMNETSEKSGPRLYADIFRVGRIKLSVAPESVNQSKSTINGIKKLDPKYKLKINVDKIGTFEALVDTGADLSVVDLRTALDTGHGISKLAKICAGPDGKKLDMVGSIFLNIKIDDETLSHNFVILKTHLRTLILGRDFLKKMNAKIDCKQETIKYDLTNNHDEINFEMLKIKSAKDSIVPECSMKLIKALVETEDGEYIIEESSKMFQTNGLRLARSLINVINRETHIWITNPHPRPLKIMKNQTLAFGSSPAKINVSREREVEKNEEPRFQINENLSPKEQKELKQVLERYGDLFSSRLGRTNLAKHRIDTEDAKPIKHKPYRVSAKERDIIKEQIDEMLTEGIIRPSSSPWSFPVILVKNRDGKYRFCVEYRKLNNVTVKDVYPIPRIDEVMDTLQGSTHFSAIDLRSGYWQVEVEERDKEKTAFTTAHGLYEFNVMPFGLCNAPATFERNMENMLGNLRWQICLCYLDDVIIYSPDFPTHLKRLEAVFRCFRESNLRLNDKKCRFAFEELEILGYITSKYGIKPAEHNIKAVRNFPRPKKVKEVQSFLGMCSYYRKFIKDFSKIADPLTNLIKKSVSFTWTERQEEAFQTLKTALLSPPILGHFNPNAPTYVHTDASNIGIGATLVQDIGGEEKVISYLSRTLSKAEQNYSTTEKECLAVVWSMSKLRPYLYGRHFKIVTDHHALCWLKNLKDPTANFPFERIGIDFVGPLPSTKNRKKWIIVLSDYYTRYAETRAVSEATVKEVSKFLVEDIFLRHGAPQYLISDRGSQFTSNLMKEVMKTCKIKHCFTTSYHPQTNGLTERLNRTLINMLSIKIGTKYSHSSLTLTIQETTGYSPFFLMFGIEPTSLLDDRNISVDIDKDDYDEYIKHHLDKINRTRKLVINNTIKTQERMKKNYDKKHMERSYEPGELVAVWTPIRKIGKCEKLLRKYFGPYRILKKLSNVNYLIEPKDNPGQDPLIVHVSRIKPYFERIDETEHLDSVNLNSITVKDQYPLPRIDDCFDSLHGSRYFTSLDLCSGYWQVEVEEQDREKTAFVTPDGLYHFNVLPFGLCNGPATFERLMDNILRTHKWKICLCYLDDVIVFSEDLPSHLTRLKTILGCLRKAGLTLNISKCRFAYEELLLLGHVVSKEGITPDPEKIASIKDFPALKTIKNVRAFLGLCSYYRRFIKEFSKIAYPLQILTQKLSSPEVLTHYDPNKPIGLHTDASDQGLGAVLIHVEDNGRERPISYASRTLQKAETNYSTTEKECLAIIWAIGKFRPYLYGRKFIVYTDHHTSRPFERIGIDLLGRFPKSINGNRWIVVCTDYYSRHVETAALPRGTATEIADFFLKIIVLRHGAPKILISDRGSSFLSKLLTQTNGQTERMNRTLTDMISMYIDEKHQNWDEILPFVTFAYNSSVQETTGYSPYFLIHGREPLTFLDSTFDWPEVPPKPGDFDDYISNLLTIVEESKKISMARTISRQDKSKQVYDKHRREVNFSPDDLVLIWTPIRKVGRADKLQKNYIGPFKIIRKTSPVNYEVKEVTGRGKKIVHVSRMKLYRTPDLRTNKRYAYIVLSEHIVVGLLSEHTWTDSFAHRIGVIDDPSCTYCDADRKETLSHIVLECSSLDAFRFPFFPPVQKNWGTLRGGH